jgi:LuxR family maltose regulon positive regulatory protein
VLAPLPDDLRLVLRRTAVLDEFGADLATAVTGRPDAPELLARAEREQLFVVPLDDRGDWYRFHHLFTEVLRDDLARTEPGLVPRLQARAARWLADHDQPIAAVRHALAGDDRTLAAALVARHAPVLTRIGQVETALDWFRALGDDACRAARGSPSPAPSPARTPGCRTRSSRGPPSPSGLSTTRRPASRPRRRSTFGSRSR